jgi:phosphomannomutase
MGDNPIHFGTSGWRGIIAETFTFPNVRLAAAGISHYLLAHAGKPRVIVGCDTRFMSERFADAAAEILNSHGVETEVGVRPVPTLHQRSPIRSSTASWTGGSTAQRVITRQSTTA